MQARAKRSYFDVLQFHPGRVRNQVAMANGAVSVAYFLDVNRTAVFDVALYALGASHQTCPVQVLRRMTRAVMTFPAGRIRYPAEGLGVASLATRCKQSMRR